MFEAILGVSALVTPALLITWWLAGSLAGRLAFRRTRGRLRLAAGVLLAFLGLAALVTAAEAFVVGQLWSYGWMFVKDRMVLAASPLLLPAAAAMFLSIPRLWRLARGVLIEPRATVGEADRSGASDPLLVVPVQATAVGSALFLYVTWFPPGLPSPGMALVLWGLFSISTATLWVRQRRRFRRMSRPEPPLAPGPGLRLLRAGAFALAICAGFVALLAYSMQASVLPDRFSMMTHDNLDHAAEGMTMHLGYEGVTTPFEAGAKTGNTPE